MDCRQLPHGWLLGRRRGFVGELEVRVGVFAGSVHNVALGWGRWVLLWLDQYVRVHVRANNHTSSPQWRSSSRLTFVPTFGGVAKSSKLKVG